jgi:LCP family protein required for cell wall assembly
MLRFGLILYAVGWAYLFIDAWRIARPLGMQRKQRLAMTALNGALCLSLTGVLLYASQLVAVQRDFIQTVFTSQEVSHAQDGRYNVLLLGGDSGRGRIGLRPDSVTLASIDQNTGRTVLFGLPRNMEQVPFPPGTVMAKQFPHGFDCGDACLLNAVYTWATTHPSLFPGVKDPGVLATTQAVEQITGLHVNYYVMVDMQGFAQLVNAVGGITINIHQQVPIGNEYQAPSGYIGPGVTHLDGYQALWYSRSRAWSDDYSRMARQKCVLNAMLHQLDPETVLTKFGAIAAATKDTLTTSIPASEIHTFVDLALKARHLPITTVSFVPPKINTSAPDWTLIRQMVKTAIARSVAAGKRVAGHVAKMPTGIGNKDVYLKKGYAANDTADLSKSC